MSSIVIVGAPGAGKGKLLKEIQENSPDGVSFLSNKGFTYDLTPATGMFADYRVELNIATNRVLLSDYNASKDSVVTHSLIDSLIYPTVRLFHYANQEEPNAEDLYRWAIVLQANAIMLRDSFRADHVLYLKGNDGDESSVLLEEAIGLALDDWSIEHTASDSFEPLVEKAVALLDGKNDSD